MTSITSVKISVVLPCFNERDNVIPLIEAIHHELADYDHQIIVVDDNSPDGTYQAVTGLNKDYVKAILRKEDPSLAKSIRAGIDEAEGRVVVVMDSDFNHQPQYIPQMVENLKFYDCVSGSRFVYGGAMDGRLRHMLSWFFNIFVRLITGHFVTDNLYGLWAMRTEEVRRLDLDKIFWGYGDYYIRFLFYLQENKAKILQFPAVNGKRLKGKGNSNFIRVFWQYTKETIKLVVRERLKWMR